METILNEYYADNAKKLRGKVDKILKNFGGLSDKDYDDFYSLANEVFVDVMRRYDGVQAFDGFLFSCLSNKIKTEITRRNREKRQTDRNAISIDTPIGENEETTIGDMIADRFTIEKEFFEKREETYSKEMCKYLSKLSNIQKEVLHLISIGYAPSEILEELHINKKIYEDCYNTIHSYKNISLLF